MKKNIFARTPLATKAMAAGLIALGVWGANQAFVDASSHREAPLIAYDPQADNTDVYAFRSPDDSNSVTIIADWSPFELPQGGPNYYQFGEDIRYEIHIDNDATTMGDDLTYRFTFDTLVNEDPTTFFNIRLGLRNLRESYTLERSIGGGAFTTIVTNGEVPPNNIGPRSINNPTVGLGMTYGMLEDDAIMTATTGETVFAGPRDDPFFTDIGGAFDLGHFRTGTGVNAPIDGLACKNVHSIALQIPISTLQKDGQGVGQATSILDADYVIGVWASSSRQMLRTLDADGEQTFTGGFVQVSRLGMPLTNEVINPIGYKNRWNSRTPYNEDTISEDYLTNPELGLYVDSGQFGGSVPALNGRLQIQRNSLGMFDFGNGQDGLSILIGNPAVNGTAFDPTLFGGYLLRPNEPRSADLLPIFHTGVPNLAPYQLATGKAAGNPLDDGKPFVNNFLPTFGDMLRLNMAVPATPRNSADFSTLGLIQAAVLGLTDARFNTTTTLQRIPNMDGFPNGRRLEDDVTTIELQAVGGIVLAAIGLFYDDYTVGGSPLTSDLLTTLGFTTGVEENDTTFKTDFPYVQTPWRGTGRCGGEPYMMPSARKAAIGQTSPLGIAAPEAMMVQNYPNPFTDYTTFKVRLTADANMTINVYDLSGKKVGTVTSGTYAKGTHEFRWNATGVRAGNYTAQLITNGKLAGTSKLSVVR